MLRSTRCLPVVFQNPTLPRVLNHVTPDRLELTLLCLKEHKKRMRYLGSHFQRYNDRLCWYGIRGNLRRGTRYVITRHTTRTQYVHPSHGHHNVDIRAIKLSGAQYDQMGNTTRNTWDLSMASTNPLNDVAMKRWMRNISRQSAINLLEQWGVRYVLLDEERKPQVVDSKYHKHSLFAHKFYWTPDPPTNGGKGDADWKWKGTELIAYDNYGAQTLSAKNVFRSLWKAQTSNPLETLTLRLKSKKLAGECSK